jgi:UDP-perosamine 4-acetyltransferase
MSEVVVVGAGGHARVVIDLLLEGGWDIACMVADTESSDYLGIPVLLGDGRLTDLRQSHDACVIAIGDNALRRRLGELARGLGYELISVVGRGAYVSPTASIGAGTVVVTGAVVNSRTVIGDFGIVNTSSSVDHDCVLGTAVHIGPGATLAGSVLVGDESLVGAGSTVIPGVSLGVSCTIGAGAVVVRDVGESATVVGVPARPREASA